MTKTACAVVTVLSLLFAAPVRGQSFLEGLRSHQADDFEAAYAHWHPLAEQGDADAQISLGLMYLYGNLVQQDNVEALRLFRLAAEQGHPRAQYNLGAMYRDGIGVQQDDGEALRLFRLAADQGNSNAQVTIGGMYAEGSAVPQDNTEAVRWYRLAAEQGNGLCCTSRLNAEFPLPPGGLIPQLP